MTNNFVYYDRATVAFLTEQLKRFHNVLEGCRRLPRPWPMFCGQSLDARPIVFQHLEKFS